MYRVIISINHFYGRKSTKLYFFSFLKVVFLKNCFNHFRWLREFIDEPHCGHIVLLKFLNHIQQYISNAFSTVTSPKPAQTPKTPTKKKFDVLSKDSVS